MIREKFKLHDDLRPLIEHKNTLAFMKRDRRYKNVVWDQRIGFGLKKREKNLKNLNACGIEHSIQNNKFQEKRNRYIELSKK